MKEKINTELSILYSVDSDGILIINTGAKPMEVIGINDVFNNGSHLTALIKK